MILKVGFPPMITLKKAGFSEAQEESSLALGRRIMEIDQQQREIQVKQKL